jgi:hypothetical protein
VRGDGNGRVRHSGRSSMGQLQLRAGGRGPQRQIQITVRGCNNARVVTTGMGGREGGGREVKRRGKQERTLRHKSAAHF